MTWITPYDVRIINGLPSIVTDLNYADDETLEYYIQIAKYSILPDFSIQVRDDQCAGTIDSSNTIFYTSYKPIIDQNLDGTIDTDDIEVYVWEDLDDVQTKTEIDIDSIDYLNGFFTTKDPVSTDYEGVTADYRYSNYEVNSTLLKTAICYLAGYLYFTAEYMELPTYVRLGAHTYKYDNSPANRCWNSYLTTMSRIKSKLILRG